MEQYVIISATNREGSYTRRLAQVYSDLLVKKGISPVSFFSFEHLPQSIAFDNCFGKRTKEFQEVIDRFIEPGTKFVFVVPEYNGSFPGILKTFIDAIHPRYWKDKKAALIGLSQGRAGNLRGIEQFTLVLNYLKLHVHYNKLPVSLIDKIMDGEGNISNPETLSALENHALGFISF